MTEPLRVRGTIEKRGAESYVRFDADAPEALRKVADRVFVARTKLPGPQTKGGEKGWFTVTIDGGKAAIVGTYLDGREPYDQAQSSSDAQATSGHARQDRGPSERSGRRTRTEPPPASSVSASTIEISAGGASHDRFIHPYNFVRLPSEEGLRAALSNPNSTGVEVGSRLLFQRGQSASHDRYDNSLNTGYIDCELTTHTDWFVPDPRKVHKPGDHATHGYFTLGPVAAKDWQEEPVERDETEPAIPGSSLRGMVRSIFETATLSCFSVFDGSRREFRATRLLSSKNYVPARVLRCDDGAAELQLLPSCLSGDQVAGAHHRCYNVTRDGDGITEVNYSGVLASYPTLRAGTRVITLVKSQTTEHPKPTTYKYREATHVFPIPTEFPGSFDPCEPQLTVPFLDQAINAQASSGGMLVFGYFCRTGWNIERKHDERVFFTTEGYNSENAGISRNDLLTRLRQFLADQTVSVTAQKNVVSEMNASLAEYAQRHEDDLTGVPRDPTTSTDPQLSDYVVKHPSLSKGDLVFALLDNRRNVVGLYPVCLPRVWHKQGIADLLPPELHPCSYTMPLERHDLLCPACRVFGWTRDLKGQVVDANSKRVDAIAGHVRFTHGKLIGNWDPSRTQVTTLPVLGSPHPTCTEFYLREKPSYNQAKESRVPPALSYVSKDGIPSYPFAMYRDAEAELRGRKFSRRRETTNCPSDDPSVGGLTRPRDKDGRPGVPGNQNFTAYVLPKDMSFDFRVYFDNLTDAELGALLFSLDLAPPESWPGDKSRPMFHTLGHGTRLGMGRCSIRINQVGVDEVDKEKTNLRYQTMTTVLAPVVSSVDRSELAREQFSECWKGLVDAGSGSQSGNNLTMLVNEFMDMLQVVDGPVHYPNRWDSRMGNQIDHYDSFTWFVANKRGNARPKRRPGMHRLPSPIDETTGSDRLPNDPAPQ